MKINSLFIYIGNTYFGIYLNKNISVNVRYKRQDTRPFYIPLFYTPQFKRSRVQVLFLVYRSGCCFHSTRVACTLELGLRENGVFRPLASQTCLKVPLSFCITIIYRTRNFQLNHKPNDNGLTKTHFKSLT